MFHFYSAIVHYVTRSGRKYTRKVDFKSPKRLGEEESFRLADRVAANRADDERDDWKIERPIYIGYGDSRKLSSRDPAKSPRSFSQRFGSQSRMEEAAEDFIEEEGYRIVQRSSYRIVLHKKNHATGSTIERILYVIPKEW